MSKKIIWAGKFNNDDLLKEETPHGTIGNIKGTNMWFALDPVNHNNKLINIDGVISSTFTDVRAILDNREKAVQLLSDYIKAKT
tara:strand:+ start:1886 stop:2137 length:252 start_codon:yes stop_codon:yes gene_type:complete